MARSSSSLSATRTPGGATVSDRPLTTMADRKRRGASAFIRGTGGVHEQEVAAALRRSRRERPRGGANDDATGEAGRAGRAAGVGVADAETPPGGIPRGVVPAPRGVDPD